MIEVDTLTCMSMCCVEIGKQIVSGLYVNVWYSKYKDIYAYRQVIGTIWQQKSGFSPQKAALDHNLLQFLHFSVCFGLVIRGLRVSVGLVLLFFYSISVHCRKNINCSYYLWLYFSTSIYILTLVLVVFYIKFWFTAL